MVRLGLGVVNGKLTGEEVSKSAYVLLYIWSEDSVL